MEKKETENLKKLLGKNVKHYRFQCRFTQEKLAERCDLSPRYISDIENGNGNIAIDTLSKIAEVLNVKPYLLLRKRELKSLPQRINMKKRKRKTANKTK